MHDAVEPMGGAQRISYRNRFSLHPVTPGNALKPVRSATNVVLPCHELSCWFVWHLKYAPGVNEMGQQVQTTAVKPDILSSIPGSHMMEGDKHLILVL